MDQRPQNKKISTTFLLHEKMEVKRTRKIIKRKLSSVCYSFSSALFSWYFFHLEEFFFKKTIIVTTECGKDRKILFHQPSNIFINLWNLSPIFQHFPLICHHLMYLSPYQAGRMYSGMSLLSWHQSPAYLELEAYAALHWLEQESEDNPLHSMPWVSQ